MQEDGQAFGLIIAKSVTLEEGFQYPIRTVPLALATTDACLRQSDKASLRNYLITKSDSILENMPKNCSRFIDGLAAICTLRPKKTYKEWLKSLIQFTTPAGESEAVQIGLINDTYKSNSIKSGTRKKK